jgi:hypothetical protein
MNVTLVRVRDPLLAEAVADVETPLRTTTVYTATGDPIKVPLLHLRCPRCLQAWEWPRGLDPDLDRPGDGESATADCPGCIDELADLRLADLPWEEG